MVSPRLSALSGAVGPLTAGLLGLSAVAAGGAGLFALTKRAADAGDEIFDLSQKVNFAAETISTLKNEGELAGVSFDTIGGALGFFNKNAEAAQSGNKELAKTFKALKINLGDNEQALRETFKALLSVEDGSQQVALAMKIFGRSGKEVLGVIKSLNGDVDAAMKKFRDMGSLITTESAQAANEFSDKLKMLEQRFEGVTRMIGEKFMPIVTDALDKVGDALDKNSKHAQTWADDLVSATEFAATQVKHILEGLAVVIEGFRKTFGKGSLFGDAIEGETKRRLLALPDGRVMDLNTRQVFDTRTDVGKRSLLGLPAPGYGGDPDAEFAIPFGRVGDGKKGDGDRLDIPTGGGGAKTHRDILENLKSTLINLNAEWRRWEVALLDSASASAEAAQKQTLLENVLSSLSSKAKVAISGIHDIDEALEKAVSSLPKKSQDSARALIAESLALSRHIEEKKAAVELDKEATRLTQAWRMEIDNSRTGADEFTKAIQDLEKAYAKYGVRLDAATRAELEQMAAQQRVLRVTRERLTVLNQVRQRVVGQDVLANLGQGSVVFRGDATRERIATADETIRREREAMRLQEMREIAEDLGTIFGDAFESIRGGWENLWHDMAHMAHNFSRQLMQELFTGLFSRAFNVPFQSQSGGIVGGIINRIFGQSTPSGTITNLGGGSTFTQGGTGATRPRVAGSRAMGGPVEAGLLYRVNERGMNTEYFRPSVGGQVIPLGQQNTPQRSEPWRVAFVDDLRSAQEWRADEVHRMRKHNRKLGRLIPGF